MGWCMARCRGSGGDVGDLGVGGGINTFFRGNQSVNNSLLYVNLCFGGWLMSTEIERVECL